ncbi:MAG: restriction endonuclease PLD domain-containing protein [Promethearchaeota archaeon]
MSLYTNNADYGGNLKPIIANELRNCSNAIIASGYVSTDILNNFENNIIRLIRKGGEFNLIVGMAFFEGISKSLLRKLVNLHNQIRELDHSNRSGIKLVYSRRFHGKIYCFASNQKLNIYLGSSNFSNTGLGNNLESTILIRNNNTQLKVKKFIKWLSDDRQSAYIDRIDNIIEIDSQKYRDDIVNARIRLDEASTYDVTTIDISELPSFDISLARVDNQKKSNLNAYFGKGRLQRSSGKIIPRNWFEVEIIVDRDTTANSLYPKGEFKVITDDGYTFICQTQSESSNYKNLRSKNNLQILGKWIKMKLQNSGALQPLTPVTSETLAKFGRDFIRLYKIGNNIYYMEFKPN